jgi:hypothetical protein
MAGYSGTPLLKKLGLKPDCNAFFFKPPESYFDLIAPLPENVAVKKSLTGKLDFIHLFAMNSTEFRQQLQKSKTHLSVNGMIWVSWPKKTSGVKSDLDENIIRDFGLSIGLVDIKVCAVDEIWSGLKFVIPLKDRQ